MKKSKLSILASVSLLMALVGCNRGGDFADSTVPAVTAPAETVSPTATPGPSPSGDATDQIVLGTQGVSVASFGDRFETAKKDLESVLGKSDQDTGDLPGGQTEWGTCVAAKVRGLRWATFFAVFTDAKTDYEAAGRLHFFYYTDSDSYEQEPKLKDFSAATEKGVSRGDTVADLQKAYGSTLKFTADDPGSRWSVSDSPAFLGGLVQDTTSDSRISSIEGGSPCGE